MFISLNLFRHLVCLFLVWSVWLIDLCVSEQMGTSVSPTPASMEGTAPTKWGDSSAPAPRPTTDQSVNWEHWEKEDSHPPHHKPPQQVGPHPQLRWPRLWWGAWLIRPELMVPSGNPQKFQFILKNYSVLWHFQTCGVTTLVSSVVSMTTLYAFLITVGFL